LTTQSLGDFSKVLKNDPTFKKMRNRDIALKYALLDIKSSSLRKEAIACYEEDYKMGYNSSSLHEALR